jgi:rhomboid protease GluP
MNALFSQYKITFYIIAVNIAIYIISAIHSQTFIDIDVETLVDLGALYGPYAVQDGEWWRLGSAMFLHAGMTHLLMNMFSLFLIGRGAEMYFDTKSYLSIYLFSGLFGGLASLYIHPGSVGVGASGAIFGVFGALAGFYLAHRGQIEAQAKAFMKDFAIIMGINMLLGFSIDSIDVSAHVGGLIVGFIGGFVVSKNPSYLKHYTLVMWGFIGAAIVYLPTLYVQTLF